MQQASGSEKLTGVQETKQHQKEKGVVTECQVHQYSLKKKPISVALVNHQSRFVFSYSESSEYVATRLTNEEYSCDGPKSVFSCWFIIPLS